MFGATIFLRTPLKHWALDPLIWSRFDWCCFGSWTVKRRPFGASCNASDREDGSLMKTEIGAPSYQSIHFILCPSVTNKSGRKASGGLLADTTPNLDGSSRCCSSAAAYGTAGTKGAVKC